jgi:hypothetical protein
VYSGNFPAPQGTGNSRKRERAALGLFCAENSYAQVFFCLFSYIKVYFSFLARAVFPLSACPARLRKFGRNFAIPAYSISAWDARLAAGVARR